MKSVAICQTETHNAEMSDHAFHDVAYRQNMSAGDFNFIVFDDDSKVTLISTMVDLDHRICT